MLKDGMCFVAVVWIGALLLSGCETAAGAGKGLAYGVYASGEGAVHDTENTYNLMMNVDEWIQENLW
jgi:predicted small secreted protein